MVAPTSAGPSAIRIDSQTGDEGCFVKGCETRMTPAQRVILAWLLALGGVLSAQPAANAADETDATVVESLLRLRRQRLVDWKRQIADLRKKAAKEADREKSLAAGIAETEKRLAASRAGAKAIATERSSLSGQREATSMTLAGHRQANAAMAAERTRWRETRLSNTLSLHVSQSPEAVARLSMAVSLAARRSRAIAEECSRLAELIRETEATRQQANGELADAEQRRRRTVSKADELAAEIRGLEAERETARKNRRAYRDRVDQLEQLARSVEKEIAGLEARQRQSSPAPAPPPGETSPGTRPAAASPTPARPRPALPANLREGTAYDLMVEEGSAVHAIGPGRVLYAGRFPGRGNLVILEHPDAVLSLYSFLSEIAVAREQEMALASLVGRSGFLEDKDRPGLRFEMRVTRGGREVVIDPTSWLPTGAAMAKRLLQGTD